MATIHELVKQYYEIINNGKAMYFSYKDGYIREISVNDIEKLKEEGYKIYKCYTVDNVSFCDLLI